MRIKEESLRKALEAANLQMHGLPRQYRDGKDPFWIKSVVLVQKRNMEECYCIYQQDVDRYMRLMQDFGTPSPILSIKSIHPFVYLDEMRFMYNGSFEDKKHFLKRQISDNGDSSYAFVDEMKESEINRLLLKYAIERQLKSQEEDRVANERNEGSDLDGTNRLELEQQQFEKEYGMLRAEGASKEDLKAFKEQFLHRNDTKQNDDDCLTEEERTRMFMESQDLMEHERSDSDVSVDGEFDAPELDLDAIRKASEEYRLEQIRVAKRKWKRAYDGSGDIRDGRVCENEFGEREKVETLQMPPKVEMPKEKRKPGRPKKQVKAAESRKRNAAARKAASKAK